MAMLGFRSISQILCVLACALHHQVVIASPAEATPEPTFPTGWYANPYAPGPATGQDTFWHSLEVGDAPAAVEVIEANIAPASAPPLGLQTAWRIWLFTLPVAMQYKDHFTLEILKNAESRLSLSLLTSVVIIVQTRRVWSHMVLS